MSGISEKSNQGTAIIITVGVSLLENLWYKNLDDPSTESSKEEILNALWKQYDKHYSNFINQLNNNSKDLSQVDFPSAEIESLVYWLAEYDCINLKKIKLLHTNTDKAYKCALIIREIINNLAGEDSCIYKKLLCGSPEINLQSFDFEVDSAEKFPENVGNFIGLIENEIETLREDNISRVVLNITAGYKVLVSIFSLFAFLKDEIEVIYKHEDTKNLLRVPPLPLTWNYKLLDDYRSIVMRPGSINFPPPPQLEGLFNKSQSAWVKNEYGTFLSELYDSERLKRFGLGKRLILYLSPESRQKLNDEKLPQWIHMWVGDQIPETVEHSRAHSSRLLEYAADLLEAMFSKNSSFLSDQELLILLYCFWLHDLGHTGLQYCLNGNIIPVGMYPSLVRKWHSFITHQQLMGGEYLDQGEKEIVAEICKYHRNKLPLKSGHESWQDSIFTELQVPPLEDHLEKNSNSLVFNGNKIEKDKVLLLCALLRICDAMDMQSDRVVDQHYWNVRKRRTREEVSFYYERFEKTKNLEGLTPCKYIKELKKLEAAVKECMDIWNQLDSWDKAQAVEDKVKMSIEEPLLRLIGQTYDLSVRGDEQVDFDPGEQQIVSEQISLLDRITFKMRQEAHFYKHSSVRLVYLTREGKKFWINMLFEPSLFEPSLNEEHKEKLAGEIWSELSNDNHNDVETILREAGIEFAGIISENRVLIQSSC